jgi:hypothetical protein
MTMRLFYGIMVLVCFWFYMSNTNLQILSFLNQRGHESKRTSKAIPVLFQNIFSPQYCHSEERGISAILSSLNIVFPQYCLPSILSSLNIVIPRNEESPQYYSTILSSLIFVIPNEGGISTILFYNIIFPHFCHSERRRNLHNTILQYCLPSFLSFRTKEESPQYYST